jgi:Zn-dependent protease
MDAQPSYQPTRRVRRAAGPIAVALTALGKYGLAVVKLAKLGPTLISMLVSLVAMAWLFGPQFGVGLLVLIAVHESGHMLFARAEGLPVSAPIFLGPFGAVIGLKRPPADARQEAVIAIGGPVVGTIGALVAFALAGLAAPGTHLHGLLLALAYVGFFLNLFNLVPLSPLDGGRVASALSPWMNLVGLGVVLALMVASWSAGVVLNPILLLILIIGGISTVQRLKRRSAIPPLPARTRLLIGAAYVSMLAITGLGMSLTHSLVTAYTR